MRQTTEIDSDTLLVRTESVAGFENLVLELGGDPTRFFQEVGLEPDLFQDGDNLVPRIRLVRLLEIASRELDCKDLGLRLADHRKALPIGTLGLLMAHSPDVGTAVQSVCDHFHVVNQGASWDLEVQGSHAVLTRWDSLSGRVPTFQTTSMALATCMKAMQYVTADAWRPELVSFSDAEPANAKAYRKVFGTKVLFSQEWTGLMFPASDLDRPIANRDDDLEALLLAKVREIERLRSTDHSFVHNVKLLIRQSLNSGHCSQDKIARLLGIHPRQFQRELQRQEVTFRELRAEVRLDLAEQLLGHSSMPLGTIALVLGFSEQSTLSRAFKTKHGISPLEWRSLQQQF